MASIKVDDLNVTELELFVDQESHLHAVSNEELEQIHGGMLHGYFPHIAEAVIRAVQAPRVYHIQAIFR